MSEKGYFPNLNGLRAIGAFIVLCSHFYFFRMLMGYQEINWFPIPGKVGVALFFSLSGFLITSLLFRELEKTHTIRLKDFYIRRMLRIWPLYYLILLLGFFVMNRIGIFKIPVLSDRMYTDITWWNIVNIILIIPNFTHYYIPYTDQRWSIIDEELFYLIQPALLRTFRNRYVLIFCFCLIVFSSEIFSGLVHVLGLGRHLSSNVVEAVSNQLEYLGCIAIGCIFSALYYKQEAITKKWLFSKWTQAAIIVLILGFCSISYFVKHNELYFDLRWYSLCRRRFFASLMGFQPEEEGFQPTIGCPGYQYRQPDAKHRVHHILTPEIPEERAGYDKRYPKAEHMVHINAIGDLP